MKSNYTQPQYSIDIVITYTIIVSLFLIFNPQSLKYQYGVGHYADSVDPFSEYIVRNTITRNILNQEDKSILPIITKGYSSGDFNYYKDNYVKYYSSASLQTIPATILAKILNIDTDIELKKYFGLLRLINALALSFFLSLFVIYFCQSQSIMHHYCLPFLIGASSGFVYFSQNLWFMSALMLMPATVIAYQLVRHNRFSKIVIFFLGLTYFLRGYEFATVYALLSAFAAMIFAKGNLFNRLKIAAIVFSIICVSFVISFLIHIILIMFDSSWTITFYAAAQKALSSVQLRTASFEGVPVPFGTNFFNIMNDRWSATAFSLTKEGIRITEIHVIMFFGFIIAVRLRLMSNIEKMIITYGVLGYLSWYIFAYQHIMWHHTYDWYIFSLTMGLSFILLATIYINRLTEILVKNIIKRNDNNV